MAQNYDQKSREPDSMLATNQKARNSSLKCGTLASKLRMICRVNWGGHVSSAFGSVPEVDRRSGEFRRIRRRSVSLGLYGFPTLIPKWPYVRDVLQQPTTFLSPYATPSWKGWCLPAPVGPLTTCCSPHGLDPATPVCIRAWENVLPCS